MGLAEILKGGDLRASLEALRDELGTAWTEASPGVKPQIASQIQSVLEKLEAIPKRERSNVDELVERRKARRATSDAGMRTKQRTGSKRGD